MIALKVTLTYFTQFLFIMTRLAYEYSKNKAKEDGKEDPGSSVLLPITNYILLSYSVDTRIASTSETLDGGNESSNSKENNVVFLGALIGHDHQSQI